MENGTPVPQPSWHLHAGFASRIVQTMQQRPSPLSASEVAHA